MRRPTPYGAPYSGKVAVAVVKNPFHHTPRTGAGENKPDGHHRSWLQREDAGISHGKSSLFFIAHDTPVPPSVTCLQGHDILPGESTCREGHPIG
jgi:hypothetical protein